MASMPTNWYVIFFKKINCRQHFFSEPNLFLKVNGRFAFQAVSNAFPAVDTFFLISGCLLSYLSLKEMDKTKRIINIPLAYVLRYLR